MTKPSKDGHSPDAWSSSLKNLDVHYSSGPNNRMFYFLSQGSEADKDGDYYSMKEVRKGFEKARELVSKSKVAAVFGAASALVGPAQK